MQKISIITFIIFFIPCLTYAQDATEENNQIEDNSFLVEEAYNQEKNIVQHIFNAYHLNNDYYLSFTQEWPLFGLKHQISYSIPLTYFYSNNTIGVNDIMINYRYQLLYKDAFLAFSPRISLIIPTGNSDKGFGDNVFGTQINLPFSKRISNSFVAHLNTGLTYLPNVEKTITENQVIKKFNLKSYNLSAGLIYLLDNNFNIMLEYVRNYNDQVINGKIINQTEDILNPGMRFAINFKKLQIVPGVCFPINISEEKTETGMFFYISFEHSFKK